MQKLLELLKLHEHLVNIYVSKSLLKLLRARYSIHKGASELKGCKATI